MNLLRAVPLALCVAFFIASCGGDEASSPSQAPASAEPTSGPADSTATHDELVARMNALCRHANKQLGDLNSKVDAAGTEKALIDGLHDALGVYEETVPKLEGLDPPPADQAAFTRFVSAINRNESIVRRMGAAARSGDSAEMTALSEAADAETNRRLRAALDLGADDCGRSVSG